MALAAASVLVIGLLLAAERTEAANAPSNLLVYGAGEFGPDHSAAVLGVVTSPNRRCLGNRRIEVRLVKPEGAVPLDVARSGDNGGWYARGPTGLFDDVTAVRVRLVKRWLGSGASALRCRGDRFELS